jgi:hypothetical protein
LWASLFDSVRSTIAVGKHDPAVAARSLGIRPHRLAGGIDDAVSPTEGDGRVGDAHEGRRRGNHGSREGQDASHSDRPVEAELENGERIQKKYRRRAATS